MSPICDYINKVFNILIHGLLGSVCHRGDAQDMDRDVQTDQEGRGCISYVL